jgi:hypothetical protein
MKRLWIAGLLLVGLAGCDSTKTEAMAAVSSLMKDPGATQFRGVEVIDQGDGTEAVCGEYNAKNSFGAYAGYSGFVYYANRVDLETSSYTSDRSLSEIESSISYLENSRIRCIEPVTRQIRARLE